MARTSSAGPRPEKLFGFLGHDPASDVCTKAVGLSSGVVGYQGCGLGQIQCVVGKAAKRVIRQSGCRSTRTPTAAHTSETV